MFIKTDAVAVMIIVGLAASSQPFAAVYFALSVYASKRGLQKLKNSLSQRTIAIQKNFLNSLYLQTAVHVIFISVPLGIFFVSFVVQIPNSAMCKFFPKKKNFSLLTSRHELYPGGYVYTTRIAINIGIADV